MVDDKRLDDLSVNELERLLYRKKHRLRRQRLQRLKQAGRVVEVAGLPPPNPEPPPLIRPAARPTGALREFVLDGEAAAPARRPRAIRWRWISNQFLLLLEISAVVGFFGVLLMLWGTRQDLNRELSQAQAAEAIGLALPEATATPVIRPVVLPSGHKPPVEGQPPQPGEAGNIPAHLLPIINAYVAPPVPTPGPEQARRIQIAAIDVDKPIVQGDDWEQLKKGVGQHIGTANPGQPGNLVLSAHNDIYGEIFRYLDQLERGDEIIISTDRSRYTYVITDIRVVEPTAVEIMDPTDHASATLISCYPYLVNTQRIVIIADLITE